MVKSSVAEGEESNQRSRSRPPQIAARLANNAPIKSETNSQSAPYAEAFRALSAASFAWVSAVFMAACKRPYTAVTRFEPRRVAPSKLHRPAASCLTEDC